MENIFNFFKAFNNETILSNKNKFVWEIHGVISYRATY